MKCEKHGVVSTFCKFCDADIVDKNDDKPRIRTPRMIQVSEDALNSLKAMAEQDAKDAARYRWLRNEADYMRVKEGSPQVCMTDEWGEIISPAKSAYPAGPDLDAAIDAILQTK